MLNGGEESDLVKGILFIFFFEFLEFDLSYKKEYLLHCVDGLIRFADDFDDLSEGTFPQLFLQVKIFDRHSNIKIIIT